MGTMFRVCRITSPCHSPLNGPGRMYFDLELVPIVVDKPREVQLVVNPGLLWRFGHGFAAGSRVGFLVNSDQTKSAQFGITPLIVRSWPIEHSFFKSYFVEGDFIFRFNRPPNGPSTNPFTFQVVLGWDSDGLLRSATEGVFAMKYSCCRPEV